jgi:hypothetical protein
VHEVQRHGSPGAVQLLQHGIVNIVAKSFLDRLEIGLVPVAGELDPVCEPLAQVVDEDSPSGAPTIQHRTSLVSAHMAVQVQVSPAPAGAAFAPLRR